MAGPVGVEELSARFVDTLIGVRSKVVTLSLDEVGRETRLSNAIVVRQGR